MYKFSIILSLQVVTNFRELLHNEFCCFEDYDITMDSVGFHDDEDPSDAAKQVFVCSTEFIL